MATTMRQHGTMGDQISETVDIRMARVALAQDAIDLCQETSSYVPDYLVLEYQSALDDLIAFSDYWGLEIDQDCIC